MWHGEGGAEPPDEPLDEDIDSVEALGAEQPRYMADPLSASRKSTREPWTEEGTDPGRGQEKTFYCIP